ncbi:hypothetical protein F4802DRAFT_72633 [Xylaria palmicola]|nr:hypothetical protein F4802DRAFT_72633 [Xylaria palmicola]
MNAMRNKKRTRICDKCPKAVGYKNWARHQRTHNAPQKFPCDSCSALITKRGWASHQKSHKACTSPLSIEPSFSGASQAQTLSKLPQAPGIEGLPYSLWHELLALTDDSLSPLIAAYKNEIQRSGGLSDLQCKETAIWSSIGLRPPLLFLANECWVEKPTPEHFLSDLILNSNEKTTVVCRGSPRQPVNNLAISSVFKQLFKPVTAGSLCALNITSELPQIKVPDWFYGRYPIYENRYEVKTNITPKFSAVDLHVGMYSFYIPYILTK